MSPRDGKSGLWVGTGAAAVGAGVAAAVGAGVDLATVVAAGDEGAGVDPATVVAAGDEGAGVDPATVVAAGDEGAGVPGTGVGLPWSGLPGVVVWLGVVVGAIVGGAGLQMPAHDTSLGIGGAR